MSEIEPPVGPRDETGLDRDSRRSRRLRVVRSRTINVDRLSKRELELERLLTPDVEGVVRPVTRADCADVERPCPFVACRHHLYLDVTRRGSIKLNFPDLEPDQLPAGTSCSLDVADAGSHTLQRTGDLMNLTRERARQVEQKATGNFVKAVSPAMREELLASFENARGEP